MKYKMKSDVFVNKIEDQAIIFHPDTEDLFYLNDTSLQIVEILSKGAITIQELVAKMGEIYDVSEEEVSTDVNELIKLLESNKFLEID